MSSATDEEAAEFLRQAKEYVAMKERIGELEEALHRVLDGTWNPRGTGGGDARGRIRALLGIEYRGEQGAGYRIDLDARYVGIQEETR